MPTSTREKGQASGQAVAEFLLVVLVLVVLIFGGIQLSQGVALHHAMDSGTAIAARALSLNPSGWSYAAGLIQTSVDENGLGAAPGVAVRVYDSAGQIHTAGWLSAQPFSTIFILEASVPFAPHIPLLADRAVTVQVRHWGSVERYP